MQDCIVVMCLSLIWFCCDGYRGGIEFRILFGGVAKVEPCVMIVGEGC